MKYVALLRGINVGGKNPVSMSQLKECFASLGFENIVTYINSGNVIFDSAAQDRVALVKRCEQAIEGQFGFTVTCSILAADELREALSHAPKWWGVEPTARHNALFVIPPLTVEEAMKQIGEIKPEYEQVAAYAPIIFWTAPLKTFSRTRYSKIVGTQAYQSITIRNANTTRKLRELSS